MPIEMPATPPPRKRGRPPGSGAATAAAATQTLKRVQYEETVTGLFQAVGMGLVAFGQSADAVTLADHQPNVAPAIADAASKDEKLGALLEMFNKTGGPWLTLAVAVLPMTLQLAANHRLIKPQPQMGIMPPEVMKMRGDAQVEELKKHVEAEMAKAQKTEEHKAA